MSTTSAELLTQLSEGADSGTADEPGTPDGAGDAGGSESTDAAGAAERQSGSAAAGHAGPADGGSGAPDKPAAVKPTEEEIQQNHLAALRESRAEIKALRAKITEFEAHPRLSAEDQAALAKLRATEKATQEQEPDFLADPKAYVDTKVAAALKVLDEAKKESTETKQKLTQKEEVEAVFRATASQEAVFVQTQPDYPQALQHIRAVRTQQLNMMFPDATAEQVSQHIAFEELSTARTLISQNKNPAEFAYQYAKTMGYSAAKAPDQKPAAKPIDKSAARTMGSGGGDGAPEAEDDGAMPAEFGQALQERFKRK